jgi:hypothetical protein
LVYGQASIAISGEIGDPGQSKTAPKGCLPNNYGILRICRQRLWTTLQPPRALLVDYLRVWISKHVFHTCMTLPFSMYTCTGARGPATTIRAGSIQRSLLHIVCFFTAAGALDYNSPDLLR